MDADYIIIGGGSAGSIMAARLSENGQYRVLLLEAGPHDRRVDIDVPVGYARTFFDPKVNWMFNSAAVPSLNARSIYYPRGKVLGGSGSINAMVFARGQAEDFDAWERAGNQGWGWHDVLPFYRKMETHTFGTSELHGGHGPIHVTQMGRDTHPLCETFFQAAQELGFEHLRDLNGAQVEGVGHYQVNIKRGRRHSSARAYLSPARKRANLEIITDALVLKIMIDNKRAVGISYQRDGEVKVAHARREVILCAGAIGSPHLLLLSGIGPAAELKNLGIDVVQDLPEVGQNLMDHVCYDHFFQASVPTLNSELGNWFGKIQAGLRYALFRRGALSGSLNQAGGFVRSSPTRERPNIQLYFCPLAYEKAPPESDKLIIVRATPAFSLSASPCRPKSRGYVRLRDRDPNIAPEIQPNLLAHPDDMAELIEAARLLRRLSTTKALGSIILQETKPGPDTLSDADFIAYARSSAYSIFHPSGTCQMGSQATNSVVDSRLRVHGVQSLRVIDAAIFPSIPSANTNAPTMMVAEKGATFILGETNSLT